MLAARKERKLGGTKMASIRVRNGKYCVIYHYLDDKGKRHQKWETYKTQAEANRRQREGKFHGQKSLVDATVCRVSKELDTT